MTSLFLAVALMFLFVSCNEDTEADKFFDYIIYIENDAMLSVPTEGKFEFYSTTNKKTKNVFSMKYILYF